MKTQSESAHQRVRVGLVIGIHVIVVDISDVTEECFSNHIVTTHDGLSTIHITSNTARKTFHLLFQLPEDIQCSR